jgi:putative colanic acid biosynthesis glycosyltransferase
VPLFSIITVTRNNLEGLRLTHSSLTPQTGRDYEWIVVDGASADETPDFLANTNARWTSEPDSGIYDAMNKGLERASGEWLLFLNAGDRLAGPETLQAIADTLAAAENTPALIFGDSLEQDGENPPAHKPARPASGLKLGLFTHHQSMLYNRAALDNHAGLAPLRYDTRYAIAADYDLTARLLARAPQTLYLARPICIFESGGLSQQNAATGRAEQFEIRKNLNLCGPFENHLIRAGQFLIWSLRSAFPNLYWRLKSR